MQAFEVTGQGGEEGQKDEIGEAEGEAQRISEGWEDQEQVIEGERSTFDEGLRGAGEDAEEVSGGGEGGTRRAVLVEVTRRARARPTQAAATTLTMSARNRSTSGRTVGPSISCSGRPPR
jgi:hypothetical protein